MRKLLIVVMLFVSLSYCYAQKDMVINQICNGGAGGRYYEGFSKNINSLDQLPSLIRSNLEGYFKQTLGSMRDSLIFSHGQIVDLKNYFKNDTSAYRKEWIAPMYDLCFLLKESSLDITSYCIEVRLSEYGQVIDSRWPRRGYSNKERFKSRVDIEKYALKLAASKNFNTSEYEVQFKYNKKFDELCWVFLFPCKVQRGIGMEYDALEITWISAKLLNEYISVRKEVH